ncbi:FliM/FliN family flagellar motor C-terminal domain-containing protein [Ruegeria sp. HKCCD7255]|uniref:FliM/FliN family flagellar motor C-terminal domain-containing protein n=1 Tax=Ruegeria sp. HKCCD7255 TaxID=2683004 RepID=UPI001489C07E|nr:flagellar motor switch protein FliM [Ruegeria sp. HKCCD7255]
MTQQSGTALTRKLSANQGSADTSPRSVSRALRLAMARAADERIGLPLSIIAVKQTQSPLEGLQNVLQDDWLLLLFSTAQGRVAAVCVDLGAVSAIVQKQTIGDVIADDPEPRPFTDTDAAMVAPLLEDVFKKARTLVEDPLDIDSLSGFEFSGRVGSARAVTLALVDDQFRLFSLTAELGGGLRQGKICIVLPDLATETVEAMTQARAGGGQLDQAAGVMRAELSGVICRMNIPLSHLSGLSVGEVLPLQGARVDKTEMLTIDRSRIALGRLGQCGGMRAVRINEQNNGPLLTEAQPDAFWESDAKLEQPVSGDIVDPQADDTAQPDLMAAPDALLDEDPSLEIGNSDQMLAEISQLAGLPEVSDGTNDKP